MKCLVALVLFVFAICPRSLQADSPIPAVSEASAAYPPDYSKLLARYASPKGVDYAAWHGNGEDLRNLDQVVQFYSTTSAPADRSASFAWHLNAYNSCVLYLILKRYPTKGPLADDEHFFRADQIVVSGRKLSLDALEQDAIRPVFAEPRVHFALNCASVSCPPLQPRPFDPRTLEVDLARLASEFINGPGVAYNASTNTATLSKIFEWYAEDFGGKSHVLAYINHYRKQPIPADATIGFARYEWELNAK